jgi:hypothetical protein
MIKICKYLFLLLLGIATVSLISACSDSDEQGFVIAGGGYVIQSFEPMADGGQRPVFTPYIYFRANTPIASATVESSHIDIEGAKERIMPGNVRQGGLYHESDWHNTPYGPSASGMYALTVMDEIGREAFDFVVFDEIAPMGAMNEIEFVYKAPAGKSPAMITARVESVENATGYLLQIMPHTPEYGYTRMNMPVKVFAPAPGQTEQLLVWMLPGNITEGCDRVMACVAAIRSGDSTDLILEGEWREVMVTHDYPVKTE